MRHHLLIPIFLLSAGCVSVPTGPDLQERIDASTAIQTIRATEAGAYSVEEKTEIFRRRTLDWYIPGEGLRRYPEAVPDVEATAAWLAILALEGQEQPAAAVLEDLVRFDDINGGRDGCVCFSRLEADAHTNVYVQILWTYILVDRHLPGLRGPVRAHGALMVDRWQSLGWVMHDASGGPVPGAVLFEGPTGSLNPSEVASWLLFCEVGRLWGDESLRDRCRQELRQNCGRRWQTGALCVSVPGIFFPSHSSVWLNFWKIHGLSMLDSDYRTDLAHLGEVTWAECNPVWRLLSLDGDGEIPAPNALRSAQEALEEWPITLDGRETLNSWDDSLPRRVRLVKAEVEMEA